MTERTAHAALEALRAAADSGELAVLCDRHGLRLMVAFGSAVDPDRVGAARDLDLALLPSQQLDMLRLLDDLYGLCRYEDLDLLDLSRAGVVARAEALGQGEPLYEADPAVFAEQQMKAVAQRADTKWLRALELDYLASS